MAKRGFTLIELLVVIGIISIFLVLISINLVGPQRRATAGEILAVLSVDLRAQQLKSMLGDSGSTTPDPYGIYFTGESYTLFKGNAYNVSDPSNFRVELAPGFAFTGIDFPDYTILYSRGSGEVGNFVSDTYEINLTDTQDGSNTVIIVNRYGTISQTI